jgi:hypothetical protein
VARHLAGRHAGQIHHNLRYSEAVRGVPVAEGSESWGATMRPREAGSDAASGISRPQRHKPPTSWRQEYRALSSDRVLSSSQPQHQRCPAAATRLLAGGSRGGLRRRRRLPQASVQQEIEAGHDGEAVGGQRGPQALQSVEQNVSSREMMSGKRE